ncbi:MAG TPA: DUF4214 domain-containing protein, partial [Bdellovibrionales bacterium]|nr:DUF4214 domain-containing protein [Bdellovibrionales bacterium]
MAEQEPFPIEAVKRAYRGVLQREADDGGLIAHADAVAKGALQGWMGSLRSMLESVEFETNIASSQSHRDVLEAYYRAFLQRELDTGGARVYLDLMKKGKRTEVLWSIATSDEFMTKVFDHTRFTEDSFEAAARKVHVALLGREPSGSESAKYRESAWRGLHGLHLIVESLVAHPEFTQARQSEVTRRSIFQALLGRDPADGEAPRVLAAVRTKDFYRAVFALLTWPEFY